MIVVIGKGYYSSREEIEKSLYISAAVVMTFKSIEEWISSLLLLNDQQSLSADATAIKLIGGYLPSFNEWTFD
jgi:hypothetical protein